MRGYERGEGSDVVFFESQKPLSDSLAVIRNQIRALHNARAGLQDSLTVYEAFYLTLRDRRRRDSSEHVWLGPPGTGGERVPWLWVRGKPAYEDRDSVPRSARWFRVR